MHVKNTYDREGLKAIGGIVAHALSLLCLAARPGISTAELDALAGELLSREGAESTPKKEYDFPGRLCISVNDEVVHGVPGGRVLHHGDLIKLDLTADKRGYVADATRVMVVGQAGTLALRLAAAAESACRTAIAKARVGMRLGDLGEIIDAEVSASGFRVIRQLCGHGVGRHTHEEPEVPNFHDTTNISVLREGMVIAIEPIITSGSGDIRVQDDGWTVVTSDGSWAAHYEETVIIGQEGAEVITVCP